MFGITITLLLLFIVLFITIIITQQGRVKSLNRSNKDSSFQKYEAMVDTEKSQLKIIN